MRVLVPFQGTAELFEYQPSHFSTNPPSAQLDKAGRRLVFTDRFLEGQYNPAAYLPTVASKTGPFGWWLAQVEAEVRPYNHGLPQRSLTLLEERRGQLTETLRRAEHYGLASTSDPTRVARHLVEPRERGELSPLATHSCRNPSRPSSSRSGMTP
ncbi:hypothetical protein DAETH_46100 (plasmid) [Deinococcus aetherius]|uniref:Uncharacterized protein n=1 Tax=Deinococcus aetherius TaxID=200252 RepID=A0ABM8ALC8_9DEIO|nr:hypothetical protein [Deinococcus aetherius]BDP44641.1 hypothetical protein DAETH_46100 [Deinococcus aetherius]